MIGSDASPTHPALHQLMAAYFHQDFYDDYGGVWETVEAFRADEPDLASALPAEIASLLEDLPDDVAAEAHLSRLGSSVYWDPASGYGYRDWLREIANRVTTDRQ